MIRAGRCARLLVLTGALSLLSCTEIQMDPLPAESARVIAVFAPNAEDQCLSDLPFPTDLAKDPATGKLNIPYCQDDAADTVAVKTMLRGQNGYAVTSPISFRFTNTVSQSTLAAGVSLWEIGASGVFTSQAVTPLYFENRNHLVALGHVPLKPATRYVVVVSDAVQDLEQQPIVPDQIFVFLKSQKPLVDKSGYSVTPALTNDQANSLEPIRKAYVPLFVDAMQASGLSRERIALAWGFTTTSESVGHLGTMAQSIRTTGAARIAHETAILAEDHVLLASTGLPIANLCTIHTGRVTVRSALAADGTLGLKADGTPVLNDEAVDYLFAVPKIGATCDAVGAGDPLPVWDLAKVAVFVHGLGRCKNDALAVANALAGAGWATLSLDGPRAGTRMLNALGDQDLDGCADQPATPELVALGTHDPNPFVIRDQLREWALELVQVVEAVKAEPWVLTGQTFQAATPQIGVLGHSWGGIPAVLAAPLADKVSALVLSATPAGFANVFAPLISQSAAATLPIGATSDEVAMAAAEGIMVFGWALEAADPLLAVGTYPGAGTLPVLVQVIETGSLDVPLHATADQEALRAAFNRNEAAQSTFSVATTGGTNVCDKPELAVGSLLQPCVSPIGNASNRTIATSVYAGMQRQAVKFLDVHQVCDPNITVPCN
ncbi:MAG: alpha/beta fold hydrolase [Deltaproteobacteria bacterium]|nr:alpha/beta fold hydrolase [Deltaproteobacteria bacterium]